jgi:sarcosine oxidase subunit delta
MRANPKGVYAERWRHSHGCGRFFNALRDTTTDHFLAFYKTGEAQPTLRTQGTSSAPRERTP